MRVEQQVWITIEDEQTDADGARHRGTTETHGTLTDAPDGMALRYDDDDGTRVRVHMTGEAVRVVRSGIHAMDMLFCAGRPHAFDYETPHGALPMRIDTEDARWHAGQQDGAVSLRYALHVGGQFVTRNTLDLRWRVREEDDDARQ